MKKRQYERYMHSEDAGHQAGGMSHTVEMLRVQVES